MYFEAEVDGQKFALTVNEGRHHWHVSIKDESEQTTQYKIDKKDYRYLENTISFLFKGSSYLVDVIGQDTDYTVYTRGTYRTMNIFNDEMLLHESLKSGGGLSNSDSLNSGMPGKIVSVMVNEGDEVTKDQPILVMEAMKMENEMRAPKDGKIKKVHVAAGENVESGSVLISFE